MDNLHLSILIERHLATLEAPTNRANRANRGNGAKNSYILPLLSIYGIPFHMTGHQANVLIL